MLSVIVNWLRAGNKMSMVQRLRMKTAVSNLCLLYVLLLGKQAHHRYLNVFYRQDVIISNSFLSLPNQSINLSINLFFNMTSYQSIDIDVTINQIINQSKWSNLWHDSPKKNKCYNPLFIFALTNSFHIAMYTSNLLDIS